MGKQNLAEMGFLRDDYIVALFYENRTLFKYYDRSTGSACHILQDTKQGTERVSQ